MGALRGPVGQQDDAAAASGRWASPSPPPGELEISAIAAS